MYKILAVFACLMAAAYAAPALLWNGLGYAAAPALIPGPYAYTSGYSVLHSSEPVEQHGYHIAY